MAASDIFNYTFQSTLPREERQPSVRNVIGQTDFNPRSHERSDNCWIFWDKKGKVFQSTLPREERQLRNTDRQCRVNFNPRSHERSDQNFVIAAKRIVFQSTLPREERPSSALCQLSSLYISIHAPTRGATAILHKNLFIFIQYRQ